jgi:hypothetical protein
VRTTRRPIVDPAAEYYEDYYAVFFLDPDGLKLEGMKYGEDRAARRVTGPDSAQAWLPQAGRPIYAQSEH